MVGRSRRVGMIHRACNMVIKMAKCFVPIHDVTYQGVMILKQFFVEFMRHYDRDVRMRQDRFVDV